MLLFAPILVSAKFYRKILKGTKFVDHPLYTKPTRFLTIINIGNNYVIGYFRLGRTRDVNKVRGDTAKARGHKAKA